MVLHKIIINYLNLIQINDNKILDDNFYIKYKYQLKI